MSFYHTVVLTCFSFPVPSLVSTTKVVVPLPAIAIQRDVKPGDGKCVIVLVLVVSGWMSERVGG